MGFRFGGCPPNPEPKTQNLNHSFLLRTAEPDVQRKGGVRLAEDVITEVAQEEMPTVVDETLAEAEEPPADEAEEPVAVASVEAPEEAQEEAAVAVETVPGRDYELIYILEPTLEEGQVQEVNGRVRTIIENDGGVVENMRVSELRRLAYEIKKRNEGLYVVINARCEPAPMREVDRVLKLEERVLRHMILRLDED